MDAAAHMASESACRSDIIDAGFLTLFVSSLSSRAARAAPIEREIRALALLSAGSSAHAAACDAGGAIPLLRGLSKDHPDAATRDHAREISRRVVCRLRTRDELL